MTQPLVGLDVGTTGVKGIAISPKGELLATASEEYELSTPRPGWAEQDPEDWWRAAQACLARLPKGEIGLSGQMHGLVVLGKDDAVLRPAILWNDQRTAAECAEIEARVGLARLIELTGNRALTGFTAPKLLWLRRHEPEAYARIRHVLLPKDYVRFRLTGERAIDAADASGTLLFDVAGRRWSEEVCGALEIPLDWLPPAYESTEVAGAGDQAAAALGVGIVKPGLVSVVLGTSGVVFAVLPAYAPDPEARVHVFCHAVPGTWHAMGVMLSAAGSFAWLRHVLGAAYGALDEEAGHWAPGVEGLLFAPYLAGERTPHADPDARGALTGLSLRHDRGAIARATLEGVAYGLKDSLELLRSLGVHAEAGRVSGGGARSALWLKIAASVLGLPLERTESEEGSAFGAALLAGVRAGVFADAEEAVARCVRVRDRIEPDGLGRSLRARLRALPAPVPGTQRHSGMSSMSPGRRQARHRPTACIGAALPRGAASHERGRTQPVSRRRRAARSCWRADPRRSRSADRPTARRVDIASDAGGELVGPFPGLSAREEDQRRGEPQQAGHASRAASRRPPAVPADVLTAARTVPNAPWAPSSNRHWFELLTWAPAEQLAPPGSRRRRAPPQRRSLSASPRRTAPAGERAPGPRRTGTCRDGRRSGPRRARRTRGSSNAPGYGRPGNGGVAAGEFDGTRGAGRSKPSEECAS